MYECCTVTYGLFLVELFLCYFVCSVSWLFLLGCQLSEALCDYALYKSTFTLHYITVPVQVIDWKDSSPK